MLKYTFNINNFNKLYNLLFVKGKIIEDDDNIFNNLLSVRLELDNLSEIREDIEINDDKYEKKEITKKEYEKEKKNIINKISNNFNINENFSSLVFNQIKNNDKFYDIKTIKKGDAISANYNISIDDNNTYIASDTYNIVNVDYEKNTLLFNVNRLKTIESIKFTSFIDENQKEKWVFYFKNKHGFTENSENIVLFFCYYTNIYEEDNDNNIYYIKKIQNLEYKTPEILYYTPDLEDKYILEIKDKFLEKLSYNYSIKRYNDIVLFNKEYISFNKNISIGNVSIPIDNSSMTNLETQENIEEYFVEEEIKKSINSIIEMEKDVYHPVYKDRDGNFKDIYKIVFNLHFRQHRGDDWTVGSNVFWNGVNNDKVTLNSDFFSYPSGKEAFQSDLLTYVNFNDADVKYQKNRLKKSFIRLSYYDSINNANQNLLNYSTVFFNSGEYFQKYIKHISDKPYKSFIVNNGNEELKENLIGIKTDREPSSNLVNSNDINVIEEYRLSSQIKVTDKYSSNNSSEGFYVYLWKTNSDDVIPQDLYLKIEFNHAGLGRTIPFMFPYDDINEPHSVKSFEDILSDWRGENSGYNIKHYNLYSYIHFKYQYDINRKRYVYYIDNDFYGYNNSSNFYDENTNTLYLNIYEVKIDVNAKTSMFRMMRNTITENIILNYDVIDKEGGSTFPIFNIQDIDNVKYDFSFNDNKHLIVTDLPIDNIKDEIIYTTISYKNTIVYMYEWKYINNEWTNINIITLSTLNGYVSSRKNTLGYRELFTVKAIVNQEGEEIIKECTIYQN